MERAFWLFDQSRGSDDAPATLCVVKVWYEWALTEPAPTEVQTLVIRRAVTQLYAIVLLDVFL